MKCRPAIIGFVVTSVAILFGCTTVPQSNDERAVVLTNSPTPIPFATPLPLDLNGIDVGTLPDEVVKKLGRPRSIKRIGENACGGRKLTYHYPGLAIDFEAIDETEKEFFVVGMQVTSSKWTLGPGIKLGISRDELARALRGARLADKEPGVLTYGLAEGSAYFSFADGKLTKIEWAMNMC